MRILYNFASRSRPDKFIACIDNIYANQRHDDYVIIASLDTDDNTMNNELIINKLKQYDKLIPIWGESKNKIDAINRSVAQAPEWDILVNMSDDMLFIANGFDKMIIDAFRHPHPEIIFDLDQIVHFPDQNQGRNCMTMHICGKKYYDRDGFIYNPRFKSLWCDIVAQEVGQIRGKYKFVNERIFDHRHPSFRQCEYDNQYRKTESWEMRDHDYTVYLQLKKEYDPTNIYKVRGA